MALCNGRVVDLTKEGMPMKLTPEEVKQVVTSRYHVDDVRRILAAAALREILDA